jgi:hypothetical protein
MADASLRFQQEGDKITVAKPHLQPYCMGFLTPEAYRWKDLAKYKFRRQSEPLIGQQMYARCRYNGSDGIRSKSMRDCFSVKGHAGFHFSRTLVD